jgi:hypothetical protein
MSTFVASTLAAGAVRITSLDTGATVFLTLLNESNPEDREFAAAWDEVNVAQADVQYSEFKQTQPEKRTIRFHISDYMQHGLSGSVEAQVTTLKTFTKRVPGKARSHKLVYTMGGQRFGPAFAESIHVPPLVYNSSGQVLTAENCSITLKELH